MQEYELELKLFHTMKGHGLFWLSVEAMDVKENDQSGWEQEIKMYNVEWASPTTITNSWYMDVC